MDVDAEVEAAAGLRCASFPVNASASQLLECIQLRRERSRSAEYQEILAKAELEALEHLRRNEEDRVNKRKLPLHTPATAYFQQQAEAWARGKGQPLRIYVMGGQWERSCDFQKEQMGYRYVLEHWAYNNIMSNEAIVVEDYQAADFVYLPHCATSIFMHVVAKFELERQKQASKPSRRKSGRGRAKNMTDTAPPPLAHETLLTYEGNLPARAVYFTDRSYLVELLRKQWVAQPAFEHCWQRESCRFLIVSVYGRHVFRGLASTFGDAAVYVTHAGMSDWLRSRPKGFFAAGNPGGPGECRAACPVHCVEEPPAVLPGDVVMPWTIAYHWTSRSFAFESRDIFAFFSGTANSCSRDRLLEVFRDSYEAQMQELKTGSKAGAVRSLGKRVLFFPPEEKLLQSEWSELAYRSRLCLAPDGDSPNTGRLIEVIMHGCVPVIISNRLQPPLHEFIEWSSIAFFVAEDAIPRLPQILESLSRPKGMRRIAERHANLEKAAHLLSVGNSGMHMLFFALQDRARRAREQEAAAGAGV